MTSAPITFYFNILTINACCFSQQAFIVNTLSINTISDDVIYL